MSRKTIAVDLLARVEGEGAFKLVVRDGRVARAELRIFEPPRFFEALLRGRAHTEAPDITARICGICPVAYQMSAVHAMEAAFGVRVDGPLRALRRLLYCGEWIESHTLHVTMLHAPDFLGHANAFEMAAAGHGGMVEAALALKKAGNAIVTLVGGREIHPINVRVGGFYRLPAPGALRELGATLERGRDHALALLRWVSAFDFPDLERDYQFVALRDPHEYPMNAGRVVSSRGLDIDVAEFPTHFVERHVAHSNALQGYLADGSTYLCGPLARYSLNHDRLDEDTRAEARAAGLGTTCRNPYRSIVVRALEVLYAVNEAIRIISTYEAPDAPAIACDPVAGVGAAATEAPRGLLFHRYVLDDRGDIVEARIVPPTSQNQATIEEDLVQYVEPILDRPDDEIRHHCEQTIRNYDPCISCATHFLDLTVDRG